jgi:hypothetical protein
LALIAGLSSLLSGAEVAYEHYREATAGGSCTPR